MAGQSAGSGTVRFVLDGEIMALDRPDPTRTVLQFLREDLGRTGTKEGCAEGDCGACTVAVAELDALGRLEVRAVNACIQFLPTLDGKELLTVESLGAGGALHPVQQAMVDLHGSQCGFCTPGFVMSLFALYKNHADPSRREIDDALAGNLCRCTGYNPIIKAAQAMYRLPPAPTAGSWLTSPCGSDEPEDAGPRSARLRKIERDLPLHIERTDRRFFAPRNLAEMAALVAAYPDATILAGGTDVGLWVTKQLREPDTMIYTGRVAELGEMRATDTHLEIGAAVSLTRAMPAIVEHWPDLEELLLRFASPPIRNAGTLGGNVANGSPIGDSMPALLALDATLVLHKDGPETSPQSPFRGGRELRLDEFYIDYRRTALEHGEFLAGIRIPLPDPRSQLRGYKVSKRFDQDISAVCGALRLDFDGSTVADARVAFGGMAATPRRARNCEQALRGQAWTEATVRRASAALAEDFQPISDMRASAGYRLEVSRNLLMRFLLETSGDIATRVYDYGRRKLA